MRYRIPYRSQLFRYGTDGENSREEIFSVREVTLPETDRISEQYILENHPNIVAPNIDMFYWFQTADERWPIFCVQQTAVEKIIE